MKTVGDKILISPDLTHLPNWIEGTIIEIENNPFVVLSSQLRPKTEISSSEKKTYSNLKTEKYK